MPRFYTLPALPYGYGDLAPFISEEQLKLHHTKHHQAYVTGANNIFDKLDKAHKEGTDLDMKATLKSCLFIWVVINCIRFFGRIWLQPAKAAVVNLQVNYWKPSIPISAALPDSKRILPRQQHLRRFGLGGLDLLQRKRQTAG